MSSPAKSGSTNNKTAKAKRKREEEERKRREEEEARVRAELAEKERIETEKRQAEEKAILAKEINELRRRELAEFYEFIQPRIDKANATRHKQRDEFKWKRVMQCDGTPDPTILLEINTFMSLWRDEHQRTNLEYTMKQTNLVLSLIKELNTVISSIPKDSSELESIPMYKHTIHELEDLLSYKWRQAEHDTMLKATDLQDFETSNFQYFAENENAAICIWANLSHNPRIKGYLFEENGFGFDLPKPLTLAHIAILGFFLKYDYYSERSLLAKCRIRSMEYTYDPIPEPLVDEPVKPVTTEDDDHEPIDPTLPAEIRKLMEQSRRREKEVAAAAAAEAQALQEAAAAQAAQENAEESQDGTVSPSALNRKKSVRDVTADLILEELADESVIDLRSHWPILPLLEVNLFNIPPQPKKVQEWNIMQVDDTDVLVPYSYPSDPTLPKRFYEEHVSLSKMETAKTKADEKTDEALDPSMTFDATIIANNPEIKRMFLANAIKQESALVFKYKIPSEIFVTDKPLLARWIKDRNHWKQEGYVDYEYSSDTRMISFKTYDFGTFALLADRHAHMPFQSWRMRPKSPDSVLFSLTTPSFEIMFEIRYDKVAVYLPPRKVEVVEEKPVSMFAPKSTKPVAPPPPPEEGEHIYKAYPAFVSVIEPIANRFMPLNELITKLRSLGLNVFPEPDSDSYVTVINKNHKLEWLAYNQMAIVSSCTAFSYSHWNAFVNDEMRIVVGCKQHLTDKSTAEEDMKCIVFNNELVGFTDVSESSQEFVVASTFTDYHAELFHLVRERFSPAAFVRVMDAHPLFVETVNQFLMSIKPLTYA